MDMLKIIISLISVILQAVGVVLIYDARAIVANMFSFGDKNEGTLGLKIVGVIVLFLGLGLLYLQK